MIGIYQIQSIIKPDKIYIGSSVDIGRRWRAHLSKLSLNKHPNIKLQNHYNKYGKLDLIFSVLIQCDVDSLISTEQFYIDELHPWFNIVLKVNDNIGKGPKKGTTHSASFKRGNIPHNKGITKFPSDEEKQKYKKEYNKEYYITHYVRHPKPVL